MQANIVLQRVILHVPRVAKALGGMVSPPSLRPDWKKRESLGSKLGMTKNLIEMKLSSQFN